MGLEAILGNEIQKLTSDLLTQRLTKEMEETRIDATETAIAMNRAMMEQLEEQASALIAHGGYILEQVRAAKDFSRRISARDLAIFIRDHLTRYYHGSEMREVDGEGRLFEIKLSPDATSRLVDFIRAKRLRGGSELVAGSSRPVLCEIDNKVDLPGRRRTERINQFHPLVRFISEDLRTRDDPFYRRVAMQIPSSRLLGIASGAYAFAIDRWIQEGVRGIQERLAYRACLLGGNGLPLSPESSERLVLGCTVDGTDWLEASNVLDPTVANTGIEHCQDALHSDYGAHERLARGENNDRVSFQMASAQRQFERYLGTKHDILVKHRIHNRSALVAATQGQIDKLTERFRIRAEELKRKAELSTHHEEVCVGVLLVS